MKNITKSFVLIISMLATSMSLASCITIRDGKVGSFNQLIGNGVIVSKSIEAPSYTQLEVDRGIEVVLTDPTQKQLTVTADENVMPYVVVTCESGVLRITIDRAIISIGNTNVVVEVPANERITRLRTSSAGEIQWAQPLVLNHPLEIDGSSSGELEGSIRAPKLTMSLSSAASADLHLEVEEFEAHISSSASADLKGSCHKASLLTNSASEVEAEELICEECEVNASSASSVEIYCSRVLRAEATSAAEIEYHGNCVAEVEESSAGSVRKKN